jgi:hypothetical protein
VRTRVIFVLASLTVVSVAIACGEAYAPEGSGEGEDAGPDTGDGAPNATTTADASSDADSAPALPKVPPACPRPKGPACALSACEQKALYLPATAGAEFPFGIATDSDFVYWLSMRGGGAPDDLPYDGRGESRLMRVDRRGAAVGSTATIVVDGQRDATALVIAGDSLYWGVWTGTVAELRRVRRDCAADCVAVPVTTLGSARLSALAAIDSETLAAQLLDGTTFLVRLVGVGSTTSAPATSSAFPALTVTSSEAIISGALTPVLSRISVANGAVVPIATLPDAAGQNAGVAPTTTDCATVYGWRGGRRMWTIALDGGATTDFATPSSVNIFDLTTDGTWLYAGLPDGPGVVAFTADGGSPTTIRPGSAFRIAVDDVGLYWGDHDKLTAGALWMMVK